MVNPGKITKAVSRYIYGHFIEHLGRCIYGGIYEEDSPLSPMNAVSEKT